MKHYLPIKVRYGFIFFGMTLIILFTISKINQFLPQVLSNIFASKIVLACAVFCTFIGFFSSDEAWKNKDSSFDDPTPGFREKKDSFFYHDSDSGSGGD